MDHGDEYGDRPRRLSQLPRPDENSAYAKRRDPPADGAQELAELLGTLALAAGSRLREGRQSVPYLRRRRLFANHLIWLLGFGERIELQVEPHQILYSGVVVYHARSHEETFVQRLFADGVRWISLEPGIDQRAAEVLLEHFCPYVFFRDAPDAHIVRSAPIESMVGVGFEVRTERRFGQVPFGASEVEIVTHTLLSYIMEIPEPPEVPGGHPDLAFDGRKDPLPESTVEGAGMDLWSALLDDFASEPDPVPGMARLGRTIQALLLDPSHATAPADIAARVDELVGDLLEHGQPENVVRLLGAISGTRQRPEFDDEATQALEQLTSGLAAPERIQALQHACSGIDMDAPVFDQYLELLPPPGLATLLELPHDEGSRGWADLRTRAMNNLHAKLEAGALERHPFWDQVHTLRVFGEMAGPNAAAWLIQRIPPTWKQEMNLAAPWIMGLGATGDPRGVPYLAMISGRARGELSDMARQDLFRIQQTVDGDE